MGPSENVRSHGWRSRSATGAQPSAYEAKLHATAERPQSRIAGWTPKGCRKERFWKAHPDTCLPPMPGNSSAFWKALPDASPPPRSRPAPEERNSRISALHQNRINYTSQNNPVENIRPHAHLVQPLQEEVDGGDGHQERGYAANQEAIPVYDHIG